MSNNKKIYVPCFIEVDVDDVDYLNEIHSALNHENGLVFYAERPIGMYFCLKAKAPLKKDKKE